MTSIHIDESKQWVTLSLSIASNYAIKFGHEFQCMSRNDSVIVISLNQSNIDILKRTHGQHQKGGPLMLRIDSNIMQG